MTRSRYFAARIAQALGIHRRQQRMSDAASEMHLLREAEAYLGAVIWEKVESIEELSIEYWNLRKHLEEQRDLKERLAQREESLRLAHEERAAMFNEAQIPTQQLLAERANVLAELESLTRQREGIVSKAQGVRRIYDGLKMKYEVLSKEVAASPVKAADLEKLKERLAELKQQFTGLKQERLAIGNTIKQLDLQLDEIDAKLEEQKANSREESSGVTQAIGDANKDISALRAELGLLNNRTTQLQCEIGRYVSRNASHNPACAAAAAEHRGLVEIMRALRRSIAMNHRLSGMN